MTPLTTWLSSWLTGESVGRDEAGNRYFRARRPKRGRRGNKADSLMRERRWVLYKGEVEASKVPAEWHTWLHHQTDNIPDIKTRRFDWQKPHQPNLSGTNKAWYPPQHPLFARRRTPGQDGSREGYQPWRPE